MCEHYRILFFILCNYERNLAVCQAFYDINCEKILTFRHRKRHLMMIILKYARILLELFFSCANDEYYVNTLTPELRLGAEEFLISLFF